MHNILHEIDAYLSEINLLLEQQVIPNLEAHNENLEQIKLNLAMWHKLMAKPAAAELAPAKQLRAQLQDLPVLPALPELTRAPLRTVPVLPQLTQRVAVRPRPQAVPLAVPELTTRKR